MKRHLSILSMMTIVIIALSGCNAANENNNNNTVFVNINAAELEKIAKEEKAIIIDVRTPQEVASGYIAGTTVFADIYAGDFEQKINALDKSKTYIVYCRSGARSSKASDFMIKNGFSKVYNLNGGIQNWSGEIVKP